DDNTRVCRDVKEVGQILEQIDSLSGEVAKVEVGLVFDWENRWALEGAEGPREEMEYEETCIRHYRQFWERSIPVDILSQESDFSSYKLVIAPMLYMLREGVGDRIKNFVRNGGTLVTTYWSGIVDENDLCFTGGFPGPLREVLGIWSEEIDALYDGENNMMRIVNNVVLNPENSYSCRDLCALIHPEEARVLAEYGKDFYKGRPALTVNSYGKGRAYYLATRPEESFLKDLYTSIATDIDLNYDFEVELPRGVIARRRADYLFLFNFNRNEKRVKIPSGMVEIYSRQDKAGTGSKIGGFGVQIFKEK
ncbi:MAG: beta-galactosidase trimerization domain-containing protein, partial [Halanaerobiales bacterium]